MRVYQDPDAALDYVYDWSSWLLPGETIDTYTLTVEPAGELTVDTDVSTGTAVFMIVSGGLVGHEYDVTNHVVSTDGREDDRVFEFTIVNQPAPDAQVVCDWPINYAGCEPDDTFASLPASGQETFEDAATEYLWRWTKMRFGTCVATLRPCRLAPSEGMSTYGPPLLWPTGARSTWTPALVGGSWYNLSCGSRGCGCSDGSTLHFEKPVREVLTVSVDGETLDPSAYRVDNGTMLVRQDGGKWPQCQDISAPLGGPGTWAVTVVTGNPVPVGGQLAAGKLARELALAACGSSKCELPKRWQSITRQGVTISAAIDLFKGLDEGKTGIWLIDSWVASVVKPDMGVSIASPSLRPTGRVTTWPR